MNVIPQPPHLTVVIPALDEEATIGPLVVEVTEAAAAPGFPARLRDVIVVDNGSTDRTAAQAAAAGARVVTEPERGYGRACLHGARAAGGAEILLFMDGDRSEVPAEMALLLAPLLSGDADLVIGSRVRGQAEAGALTGPQLVGNRVATWALGLLYRLRVTDLGPFRAIRRDDLLGLGMTEMTYGWPTEMLARAAQAGLRVHEIPVSCRRRVAGTSKVSGNARAAALTAWRVTRTIAGVRRANVPRLREAAS